MSQIAPEWTFEPRNRRTYPFHSSGQFREKNVCIPQVRRIQTLIEPAIDRSKNIARISAALLLRPKCGERDRRPKLPELRLLHVRQCDRVYQAFFRHDDPRLRQGEECLGP